MTGSADHGDLLAHVVFGDAAEQDRRTRLRDAIHAEWWRLWNPLNGVAWADPERVWVDSPDCEITASLMPPGRGINGATAESPRPCPAPDRRDPPGIPV